MKKPAANKRGNGKSAVHIHFWLILPWLSYTFATRESGGSSRRTQPLHRSGQRKTCKARLYHGPFINYVQACESHSLIEHFNICYPMLSILLPISLNFRSIPSIFAEVIHKLLKSNWGLWNRGMPLCLGWFATASMVDGSNGVLNVLMS